MEMRRLFVLPVLVALLAWSAVAFGIAPDNDADVFDIPLPNQEMLQQPIQHRAPDDAARHVAGRYGGTWTVSIWNPVARAPETILGSGIDIAPGGLGQDATAAGAARDFVAANPEVFGAAIDALVMNRVVRGLGKVAVHFDQSFHGIPVIGGRARLLFTETGRLYAFGSSCYRDIDVNPVPLVGELEAESIAVGDLPFDHARDAIDGAPELLVLPVPMAEGGATYRLVWRVRVTTSEPYGIWVTHVDAHDGRIVYRFNDVHSLYSGTSEGDVDNTTYCMSIDVLPLRDMDIDVDGIGTTVTDANGEFSLVGSGGSRAIHAEFDGPEQNIQNQMGADAMYDETIDENVPHTIYWTDANSHAAERSCFYWVNESNAWIVSIDATYAHPKYTCNVNVNATCNANWGGNTMNFFREGGGCGNTGRIGDVMAHEFGHGVQDDLLGSQGGQGLGEGNGDILGSMMVNDSVIGRGFYLNDCSGGIRDCDNTLIYPDNVVGQPIHSAGRVICGFNWDTWHALEVTMGQQAGFDYCANLWHYSRKLWMPMTQPDQVLAYFVIDDDDGDVHNGTPNYDDICIGASAHNFECPEIYDITLTHSPLPWTLNHATAYVAEASVVSQIAGAEIDQVSLFYRIDGGGFVEVPMINASGDVYTGDIPAQVADARVEYYVYANDTLGNERTIPADAPTSLLAFLVFTDDVLDDLELATGWTVGAPDDNASSGHWERLDPNGYNSSSGGLAQPEDDHTPEPGILCFVTGNAPPGSPSGENDVDDGKTTVFSPVMDLSPATQAAVSYWRWYANDRGNSPGQDPWIVDVSNDGGATWTSIESGSPPAGEQGIWMQIDVDLIALFGQTDLVQFRFVATDDSPGSLVEAAVDDFLLEIETGTTALGPAATAGAIGRFVVHEPRPNPFNPSTTLGYETPVEGRVEVAIYDAAGRMVRSLVDESQAAGAHRVEWDGRDQGGRTLASGVYHVRVTADGAGASQKMVLLK